MPLKILIAHADELFRTHLSERLGAENLRVFQASQGDEAGDILQQEPIDVILLGKVGLEENRLNLLKRTKGMKPHIEVILLTEAEDHSLKGGIEAMQLGAFDEILLPVDIQTLLGRIREAFKRKKERLKADASGPPRK